MRIFKFCVIFLCVSCSVIFVIAATMIIKTDMINISINDNISSMKSNVKYKKPAKINGVVPVITQKINGGYACIEMLSEYLTNGSALITEEILYEENNKRITTATCNGFNNEIKRQFPEYEVRQYKNIKNSELLDKIYESLLNDMPVICPYAVLDININGEDEGDENEEDKEDIDGIEQENRVWIMQYCVITEIDIPGDKIILNNPYGYTETYTIKNFLKSTRFDNYENMQFYIKLGFAVEAFTKNTVYILEKREE